MNPDSRFAASCIALAGATIAILVSASLNTQFAFEMGAAHSPALALTMAAGALAATLLAASMPACAASAFGRWDVPRGLAASILWMAAVAFSVVAAVGAASVSRSDLASSRAADEGTHARSLAEHRRLSAELASIEPARTAAELKALIASKLVAIRGGDCSRWVRSTAARAACTELADLRAEAARSTRRVAIEGTMRQLGRDLAKGPAPKAGDPQAIALAAYAKTLGHDVAADRIGPWLALGTALFFEIAAALGLFAAGIGSGLGRTAATTAPCTAETVRSEQPQPTGEPANAGPVVSATNTPQPVRERSRRQRRKVAAITDRETAANAIKEELRKQGGRSSASIRDLAIRLGARPTTIHVALGSLLAAGVIERAGGALVLQG